MKILPNTNNKLFIDLGKFEGDNDGNLVDQLTYYIINKIHEGIINKQIPKTNYSLDVKFEEDADGDYSLITEIFPKYLEQYIEIGA